MWRHFERYQVLLIVSINFQAFNIELLRPETHSQDGDGEGVDEDEGILELMEIFYAGLTFANRGMQVPKQFCCFRSKSGGFS